MRRVQTDEKQNIPQDEKRRAEEQLLRDVATFHDVVAGRHVSSMETPDSWRQTDLWGSEESSVLSWSSAAEHGGRAGSREGSTARGPEGRTTEVMTPGTAWEEKEAQNVHMEVR